MRRPEGSRGRISPVMTSSWPRLCTRPRAVGGCCCRAVIGAANKTGRFELKLPDVSWDASGCNQAEADITQRAAALQRNRSPASSIASDCNQSRPVAQDAGTRGRLWPIRNTRECRQRAATAAPPGPVAVRNVGKHVN